MTVSTAAADKALALASRGAPVLPADLVAAGVCFTRTTAFQVLRSLEAARLLEWSKSGWELRGDPS